MEMPQPAPQILARKAELLVQLTKILPANAIISDPFETRAYECDALTAYKCPPLAVVLPASTEEVSDVLRLCHGMEIPVVPRGAGTSLAGGALPTADSVVLGVAPDERGAGNRLREPFYPGANWPYEPIALRARWRNRVFSMRLIPQVSWPALLQAISR